MANKAKFCLTPKERFEMLREYYDTGFLPALYDALVLCDEYGFTAPEWVIKGARDSVGEQMQMGKPIGSTSSIIQPAKYRARMKHLRRWQIVKSLQLTGSKIPKVFDEAKKHLKKTFAGNVTSKTIEASYYRVKSAFDDPQRKHEYYSVITDTSDLTDTPVIYPKNSP